MFQEAKGGKIAKGSNFETASSRQKTCAAGFPFRDPVAASDGSNPVFQLARHI
jgi:hypothetical protein